MMTKSYLILHYYDTLIARLSTETLKGREKSNMSMQAACSGRKGSEGSGKI